MTSYLDFVTRIQSCIEDARAIQPTPLLQPPTRSESKALLFSPHPDDECITGTLPLRLMRETGRAIINVPVTYGSNPARQSARAAELADACGSLGWEIHHPTPGYAPLATDDIAAILQTIQPQIIFTPHEADWNPRHISTHHLVVDALRACGPDFTCLVVETEFWGAMDDPNLMVEADARTVADLVAATALHRGEVARNPYHLLLPAWMQDNVRRGGELVGGAGSEPPAFAFATLYRLRRWQAGAFETVLTNGTFVPIGTETLKEIF